MSDQFSISNLHALIRRLSLTEYLDLAIYGGFLIFVIALPFGYTTAVLNGGLLLSLVGWIGHICTERKFEWKRTPLDIPIAVFLTLALVASALAPHRSTSSLGYFWKLFRAVLLFYAVIHSRLGTRWRHLVLAFILAGALSSTLGLWYYVNGSHLGLDYMSQIELAYQEEFSDGDNVSVRLRQALANSGVRLSPDAIVSPSKHYGEWEIDDESRNRKYAVRETETHLNIYMIEPRLAGTFKMPNDLGAYLALVIPMTTGYLIASWRTRQGWKSVAAFSIITCVMIANLALTLTRGAWVGVFVATTCIVLYFERRLIWGLVVLALLSPLFVPNSVKERFETIPQRPSGFLSERPQWWKTSVQLVAKYPITGIGLGRFRYEYQLHGPPNMYHKPYHAHNIYLQIAVEQGIPSLIVFLWLLFPIFRQLVTLRRDGDFWRLGLFIGGSGFLISTLVYGLADHVLHQRPLLIFWFLTGLIFYVAGHRPETER